MKVAGVRRTPAHTWEMDAPAVGQYEVDPRRGVHPLAVATDEQLVWMCGASAKGPRPTIVRAVGAGKCDGKYVGNGQINFVVDKETARKVNRFTVRRMV